ncbi:MAG: AAA family ATPase [Nocardioides sp.]
MRILSVTTSNIGGVVDGTIVLPPVSFVALAGGNGTGKSKLLACILSPWSGFVPPARAGSEAQVDIQVRFRIEEREALNAFSQAVGWGPADVPEDVVISFHHHPTAGTRRSSTPVLTVLNNAFGHAEFIKTQPSLNVVYLPAERRLLPAGSNAIDLSQLSELIALQKTAEPRNAVQNYGRLDDQEFESFARALCVAASLPNESGQESQAAQARAEWDGFLKTVNAIIAPKELLPLTRQNPEQLRIRTPAGSVHGVQDLSSGERQALIIISRVLRAGVGHSLVLVDEPDAYLHPHLSQRLVRALEKGVGETGQLIVATHSPAILDALPPSSIVRMSHETPPRLVADESERLELYRSAGFRASTLTQADLLVVVEGKNDAPILRLQFPDLARASVQCAGGRAKVFREVDQLAPYELPIIGVVDRDIDAPTAPDAIADLITVWPTGDIEGVYLSDDVTLQLMVDNGLIRPDYADLGVLRALLNELVDEQRDNVIAEIAQRRLRLKMAWDWPSPKGNGAVDRLLAAVNAMQPLGRADAESALADATTVWDTLNVEERWTVVRAKAITNQFASRASEMRSGQALLEVVAREQPALDGLADFATKLSAALA